MAWNRFRQQVLRAMFGKPSGPDQIARAIASAYDFAMRSPSSGDTLNRHKLIKGNKQALALAINSALLQQSFSPGFLPPNLPVLIAMGFPSYWVGAQLQPGPPPSVVPPGIISSMVVLNPGMIIPRPFSQIILLRNLLKEKQLHQL